MTIENQNNEQPASQTEEAAQNEKNSKLLRGILIGAAVGGAVALIDSTTRSKVKKGASSLKDGSVNMFNQVRENPSEMKDSVMEQIQGAKDTLQSAITDAQHLYDRVNKVVGRVNDVVKISSQTLSIAKGAKNELGKIGSKVKEAGTEVTEGIVSPLENSDQTQSNRDKGENI